MSGWVTGNCEITPADELQYIETKSIDVCFPDLHQTGNRLALAYLCTSCDVLSGEAWEELEGFEPAFLFSVFQHGF